MTYERERHIDTEPLNIEYIVSVLRNKLPKTAKNLIFEHSKKPEESSSSGQIPSNEGEHEAGLLRSNNENVPTGDEHDNTTPENEDDRKTANPEDQAFFNDPDDPKEHTPRWHRHGVLTHSELFRQFMESGAHELLRDWAC